jgi:hypothetical protein
VSRHPRSARGEVIRRPETKSFILTSEFWVAGGAAAAVFFGGYVLDDIADATSWRYATWIAIAYIVSRGIAKAGSQRSYQPEPYDDRADVDFWGEPDRGPDRSDRDDAREGALRSPRAAEPEVEREERQTRPPIEPSGGI